MKKIWLEFAEFTQKSNSVALKCGFLLCLMNMTICGWICSLYSE